MASNTHNKLAYFISKQIGKAIADYNMIDDGDKIMVAVSGGKDSMTLLEILNQRRSFVPIDYDLIAVHVDMGYGCLGCNVMEGYLKEKGYDYRVTTCDITKKTPRDKITCFWCSWNRRRVLFETAAKLGCNKIALGHHKDDIVQTFMLNLIFQGEISAMSPRQELFKGKIVLIRPLAYVEEKSIVEYARYMKFPRPHCRCPNAGKTQRAEVKKFIRQIEKSSPNFKTNIFRSLQRIKREYLV